MFEIKRSAAQRVCEGKIPAFSSTFSKEKANCQFFYNLEHRHLLSVLARKGGVIPLKIKARVTFLHVYRKLPPKMLFFKKGFQIYRKKIWYTLSPILGKGSLYIRKNVDTESDVF